MSIGIMRANGADGDRRFYTGMAVAILVTVFAGFAPTFYLKRCSARRRCVLVLAVVPAAAADRVADAALARLRRLAQG